MVTKLSLEKQQSCNQSFRLNLKSYVLVAFLVAPYFVSFITTLGLTESFGNLFLILFLYLPFIFGILFKKIKLNPVNALVFFIFLVYVIYCENNLYFAYDIYTSDTNGIRARVLTGCSSIFALLFFGLDFEDKELKDGLKIASYLSLLICIIRFFTITIHGTEFKLNGYDMNFGYTLLLPTLLFLTMFFLEDKKKYLFTSLFSLIFIFIFGSRGPVLCFLCCFAVEYILLVFGKKNQKGKLKTIICFLIIALFCILAYFLIPLIISVQSLPRTLQYLFDLKTMTSSDVGRTILAQDVLKLISTQGFYGRGLLSDQGNLGIGKYSHNLFLESIITFGKIPGTIFLLFVFTLVLIVAFSKKITKNQKAFFYVFATISITKLMISNSFWYETTFWCMLSLGLNLIINKKKNIIQ